MKSIIYRFYKAFQSLDHEAMNACYHPDAEFEDPAFGKLKGRSLHKMWEMLCTSQKGKDFQMTYDDILQSEHDGEAHWEAKYTFSKTGRKVHNIIKAKFIIKDGLIYKHNDHFNLRIWAKQAMGWKGQILGGTGFFKKNLQKETNKMLSKYMAK